MRHFGSLLVVVLVLASCNPGSAAPSTAPPTAPPTMASASFATANGGAADASSAQAPATPAPANLDAALEKIRAENGLPALAGAVLEGDRVIALGAVGVRKMGDATPITPDDRWHLGSCTKAMTATLFALFVDSGKIAWSTTLGEAFPAWTKTMSPAYRAVTMDMLMSHWGGAPGELPNDVLAKMSKPGDSREQRLAAVRAMLERAPETPPGTKYVYANAGYMFVGAALEQLAGEGWESMMRTRIFAPLEMTSCGFGAAATQGKVDQPWGHTLKDGKLEGVPPFPDGDNAPSLGPAGTVHCSLRDWAKFAAAHLHGARGEPTIVSPASMTKLHTPWPGDDYAKGWVVEGRPWANGMALTHSGSNTMSFATVWIAPNTNRIFLVATNRGDAVAAKAVDSAFAPLIRGYGH